MAKLSSTIRAYAIKDINEGMANAGLRAKYDISPSAISYLRLKASGSTPVLLEFKERIGDYSEERIIRLFKQGIQPNELAKDYETTASVMKDYLEAVYPMSARPKTSGKRIVVRGANKTKTKTAASRRK